MYLCVWRMKTAQDPTCSPIYATHAHSQAHGDARYTPAVDGARLTQKQGQTCRAVEPCQESLSTSADAVDSADCIQSTRHRCWGMCVCVCVTEKTGRQEEGCKWKLKKRKTEERKRWSLTEKQFYFKSAPDGGGGQSQRERERKVDRCKVRRGHRDKK